MDASFGARVRQRRQQMGMTLETFAQRSGVSRAGLSKIERGERRPGLAVAVRIADALGMQLPELLGQDAAPAVQVLRGVSQAAIVDAVTGVTRESPFSVMDGVEVVRYTIPAHKSAGPFEPHSPGTREVFAVMEGEVAIRAGHHRVELSKGDLSVLPGDVSHVITNTQDSPAVLVLFIARRH
ncbi:helix-turn-helix domain-containing protein [Actinomadura sp. B10D3]|uniref:helix-turn-helix domain-containing protein n=1 Tax=Actinomadura sp. B10D3 TaxID=3153557 RepID=UPI00325DEC1D